MAFVERTQSAIVALTAAGAFSLAVAPTAAAGSKSNPAPIVFAGQGGQSNTQAPAAQSAPRPLTPAPSQTRARTTNGPGGKRIEFRYPDQPDTFYSGAGARTASDLDPMVFSSSESAIAPEQAREFASVTAPTHSVPQLSRDPAITHGGFDARAAAARIEETVATPPMVETVPMTPIAATPRPETPAPIPAPRADGLPSGVSYAPIADPSLDQAGVASWYGEDFHGAPTANGETFDMNDLSAAHPTLPLPSLVQVINTSNGREVVVRVNDRGPFGEGGIIEVSKAAADALDFGHVERANVRIRYLGPAPVQAMVNQGQGAANPVLASLDDVDFNAPPPVSIEPSLPVPDPVYTSAPDADVGFYVQVGSFSDIANAQALHGGLSTNMPVEIVPARVNGADYFRVFVGPLDSRATADALRNHLDERGIAAGMVVTR